MIRTYAHAIPNRCMSVALGRTASFSFFFVPCSGPKSGPTPGPCNYASGSSLRPSQPKFKARERSALPEVQFGNAGPNDDVDVGEGEFVLIQRLR